MTKKEKIKVAVFRAIDEINQQLLEAQRLDKSTESLLTGNRSALDSLTLINLIIIIEREIQDEFNVNITLLSENLNLQQSDPFKTIETLINYIFQLIDDE